MNKFIIKNILLISYTMFFHNIYISSYVERLGEIYIDSYIALTTNIYVLWSKTLGRNTIYPDRRF